MKEIEVKFEVGSLRPTATKLRAAGALLVGKGDEESFFFDTPGDSLRDAGKRVRLRRWGGQKNTLTLKTKPEGDGTARYKIRDEYEIEVDDFAAARKILKELGLSERFHYKKYREHWKLQDAFVELDKISGRYFVEIEASEKRINEVARFLGLSWEQATKKSYFTILKESRH